MEPRMLGVLLLLLFDGSKAQLDLSEGPCNLMNPCIEAAQCTPDPKAPVLGQPLCKCPAGTFGDGRREGNGCNDIDECRIGAHTCDLATQICENLRPGFKCHCRQGYKPLNGACIDIDECTQSATLCGTGATCQNLPGSYKCICEGTNHFDETLGECRDRDECVDDNGMYNDCDRKNGMCVDYNPGYECFCKEGYRMGNSFGEHGALICEDVDECATGKHRCPRSISRCVNLEGSYMCECDESIGWTTSAADNKKCENLNECEKWPLVCGDLPCCMDLPPPLDPSMGRGYTCTGEADEPDPDWKYSESSAIGRSMAVPAEAISEVFQRFVKSTKGGFRRFRKLQALQKFVDVPKEMLFGPKVTCPMGYIAGVEEARTQYRGKAIEAVMNTVAGPNKADPAAIRHGILSHSNTLANEFSKWYYMLATLPQSVAGASRNATSVNPMADTINAAKTSEQFMAPFLTPFTGGAGGGGSSDAMAKASELGYDMDGTSLIANAGVDLALLGAGYLLSDGPANNPLMDRSGLSRQAVYRRFPYGVGR